MHNTRLLPSRAPLLRLLMLLGMAAALIVGLLTMHATGPHNAPATAAVAPSHAHDTAAAAAPHPGVAERSAYDAPCDAGCSGGEHDMGAAACVLALMVLLVFLAPRQLHRVLVVPHLQRGGAQDWEGTAAPLRPPSLEFLSISRR